MGTLLHPPVQALEFHPAAPGGATFVPLADATGEQFAEGFANKLGGQINLVLRGLDYITDGGSFTLITGILASVPVRAGSISATANGGLHSFVTSAAAELPRRLRINAVSPNVVEESLPKYSTFFPGFRPVPAAHVAEASERRTPKRELPGAPRPKLQ